MPKTNYPYIKDSYTLDRATQHKLKKYLQRLSSGIITHPYTSTNNATAHRLVPYINTIRKTYPHFLKFDITKFYVNIKHQQLHSTINDLCQQKNYQPKKIGRRYLDDYLQRYLAGSPFANQNIPTGSILSKTLADIYLIPLEQAIVYPYTRYVDDFIVFFKDAKALDGFVRMVLLPTCQSLQLNLHPEKLLSGKFATMDVEYLGFKFSRGVVSIMQSSVDKFRQKIKQQTSLNNRQPLTQIIKNVNHQIDGFGHYYKIAKISKVFEAADKYIRARIRRYANQNMSSKNHAHFSLTNATLDELGLHRLSKIISPTEKQNSYRQHQPDSVNTLRERLNSIDAKLDRVLSLLLPKSGQIPL